MSDLGSMHASAARISSGAAYCDASQSRLVKAAVQKALDKSKLKGPTLLPSTSEKLQQCLPELAKSVAGILLRFSTSTPVPSKNNHLTALGLPQPINLHSQKSVEKAIARHPAVLIELIAKGVKRMAE
eukprot:SM000042S15411  [mRNA]  locus=s42:762172:763311:- [translate_table: standard]